MDSKRDPAPEDARAQNRPKSEVGGEGIARTVSTRKGQLQNRLSLGIAGPDGDPIETHLNYSKPTVAAAEEG